MTFQKPFLKSAKSSSRKKPKVPQIRIKNPLRKDIFVNAMELTLDSYFNVKGIAEIRINNNIILDPVDAGDFRKYKLFQIPLQDQILKQNNSIDIYIWNPTDDDIVELSANISVSENPNAISLSGIPSDPDQINRHVSGSETGDGDSTGSALFEHKLRTDLTEEKLLNLNGSRNLIVSMSASTLPKPTIIQSNFSGKNFVDNDLETFGGLHLVALVLLVITM